MSSLQLAKNCIYIYRYCDAQSTDDKTIRLFGIILVNIRSLCISAPIELSSQAVQVEPCPVALSTSPAQTVMTLLHCTYVPQGAQYLTEEGTTVSSGSIASVQTCTLEGVYSDTGIQVCTPESMYAETSVQTCEPAVECSDVNTQTELQETHVVARPGGEMSVVLSPPCGSKEVISHGNETKADTGRYTMDASITIEEATFTFVTVSSDGASVPDSESQEVAPGPAEDVELSCTFSVGENTDQGQKEAEAEVTKESSKSQVNVAAEGQSVYAEVTLPRGGMSDTQDDLSPPITDNMPFAGHLHRRKSAGNALDGADTALPPHPPISPMIRSRYPRRQRADFRLKQMYVDSCTWKATPPRRALRHKRPSDRPYHSRSMTPGPNDEGSVESLPSSPIRGRTSSDSSMLQRSVPSAEFTVRPVSSLGVEQCIRRSPPPILDEPFIRDCWFRKSPSPSLQKPKLSPVRKLKTAAELLRDSKNRRRSRSRSRDDMTCTLILSSSSSNKENYKCEKSTENAQEQQIPGEVSWESTPTRKQSVGKERCAEVTVEEVKLVTTEPVQTVPIPPPPDETDNNSPPNNSNNCKPPLQDRTNESKVTKMKEILASGGQQEVGHSRVKGKLEGARPKEREKERPKVGTVATCAQIFQSKTKSESTPISETCKTKAVTVTVTPRKSKADTNSTLQDGESPSKARKQSSKSDDPDQIVSLNSEEKMAQSSPSSTSKVHKLFGVKTGRNQAPRGSPKKSRSCKGSTSSQKGAISTLCVSAMHVEVEDRAEGPCGTTSPTGDTPTDSNGGPATRCTDESTERRKKGKFLDGNWLQKPKKFFKVSK